LKAHANAGHCAGAGGRTRGPGGHPVKGGLRLTLFRIFGNDGWSSGDRAMQIYWKMSKGRIPTSEEIVILRQYYGQ